MGTLSGKVALVTGASKGIGAGIAQRLAADGAWVIVNYVRSKLDAQAVVDRIEQAGGKAHAIQADVSDPGSIDPLIDAAHKIFGRLDILVNNAGIYKGDSLTDLSSASIDAHYALNVKGLLLTSQSALRVLPKGGVIINISSGLAKSPFPTVHVYCSTKGAVDTLTRSMGMELGPRGIRVVGIAPGFVATEGNAESRTAVEGYLVSKTPLGRIGQPEDIAAVVSFAASDDARWITATTIDVAGGMVF